MIFENEFVRIEVEPSTIPWLKLFAKPVVKEFSECSKAVQQKILSLLILIEKEMLVYFKADKINIASFGNMLPEVHWHIMARFEKDSHFPEPMWGQKQREAQLDLPDMSLFVTQLVTKIKSV